MREIFSNRSEVVLSGVKRNHWGIILAGGEGKRLKNFISRIFGIEKPKQYCNIIGTKSLIRQTRDRALKVIPKEHLVTILNKEHFKFATEEIGDQPPDTFVIQPVNKDTGAGILLPLLKINKRDRRSIVTTFPSDHFIHEENRFMYYVQLANKFVEQNPSSIVMLGISSKRFEPGYGWIEKGIPTTKKIYGNIHTVKSFCEKPTEEEATNLISKGALWNTFVLVGATETFLKYFQVFTPNIYEPLAHIKSFYDTSFEEPKLKAVYNKLDTINFSSAILEKIPNNLYVMEVPDVYWSDWGEEQRISYDIERFGFRLNTTPQFSNGNKILELA